MTFGTKFLLFVSICVPPNDPITACGATSFPGYHSFPKWAISNHSKTKTKFRVFVWLLSTLSWNLAQVVPKQTIHLILKVSHLDPFWNRGTRALGNGLLCNQSAKLQWNTIYKENDKETPFLLRLLYEVSTGGAYNRWHQWHIPSAEWNWSIYIDCFKYVQWEAHY